MPIQFFCFLSLLFWKYGFPKVVNTTPLNQKFPYCRGFYPLLFFARARKNIFVAEDIACRRCHGWITKDKLGIVGVGESWIESNQLYYIDGGVVDIVQ